MKAYQMRRGYIDMTELEVRARRIAAIKMRLVKDPNGKRLPDDLWRQCLPEARREAEKRNFWIPLSSRHFLVTLILSTVMFSISNCQLVRAMDMPPASVHYDGKVEVRYLSRAEANRICRAAQRSVAGCMLSTSKKLCIVVINAETMMDQNAVLQHEIGHCAGWHHVNE